MKTCCDLRILHCLTGSRATCLASKCAELISAEVVRKYALTVCRVVLLYKVLDLFESLATCHVAGPPNAVANRTDSASFRGPSSIEFSLCKVFGFFKQRKFLFFFAHFHFSVLVVFWRCRIFRSSLNANSTLAVLVEASRRSHEIAQSKN